MEQKEKFTPGPWHVCQHVLERWTIDAEDNTYICGSSIREIKSRAQSRKNADLLATAPEMYDQLKGDASYMDALADVLESHFQDYSKQDFRAAMMKVVEGLRKRAANIQALLAKARGEKRETEENKQEGE